MNINAQALIHRSIDSVWHELAEKFTDISRWYKPVTKSYPLDVTKQAPDAPVAGRVCEFKEDGSGAKAVETIIEYDKEKFVLEIDVQVAGAPAIFPVKSNTALFTLAKKGENETEVSITTDIKLKPHAYLLYPLLKLGLNKNFKGLLMELKSHAETMPAR